MSLEEENNINVENNSIEDINNIDDISNSKYDKKILIVSIIMLIIIILSITLIITFFIYLSEGSSHLLEDVVIFMLILFAIPLYGIYFLPSILTLSFGFKFWRKRRNKNLNLCRTFGLISLIINCIALLIVFIEIIGYSVTYKGIYENGDKLRFIINIIISVLLVLSNLMYVIFSAKRKENKVEKEEIKEKKNSDKSSKVGLIISVIIIIILSFLWITTRE